MNNNFPLISIIIPTYQRPDNLLRAISSAQKQTYPNIEIIVVDDNGIDLLLVILGLELLKEIILIF